MPSGGNGTRGKGNCRSQRLSDIVNCSHQWPENSSLYKGGKCQVVVTEQEGKETAKANDYQI